MALGSCLNCFLGNFSGAVFQELLLFIIFCLAVSTCSVTFVLIARYYSPDGGLRDLEFRQFGMHPLLMVTGFGFCAPVGTISYQTATIFGAKRTVAKAVHLLLQTAAFSCGVVGVASMYLYLQDGEFGHYATAHSW